MDDTNIIITGQTNEQLKSLATKIISEIKKLFASLNLTLNLDKTMYMTFFTDVDLGICVENTPIKFVKTTTFLGLEISSSLSWEPQCVKLIKNLNLANFLLRQISKCVSRAHLLKVYHAFFGSHMLYGIVLWGNENLNENLCKKIFGKQKTAIRIIYYGRPYYGKERKEKSCRGIFKELKILTLTSQFILNTAIYVKKYLEGFVNGKFREHNTRTKNKIHQLHGARQSPQNYATVVFNKLPISITREKDLKKIKKTLKDWLMEKEFYGLSEYFKDSTD